MDKNKKQKNKQTQYLSDAKKIIEFVGKDNIVSATHCQTRIRLVLKDKDIIKNKEIEKLSSVSGTFYSQGQYQIVIGTDVSNFFIEFSKVGNTTLLTKGEQNEMVKVQGNLFQQFLSIFSETFILLIPVIVAGGLILAFRNILELDWNPDVNESWTFVGNYKFLSGLDNILWLPANAIFWYLPVHVVWATFNRNDKAPVLGIVIGIMLVSPSILVNYYDIAGAIGLVHLGGDITITVGINGMITAGGITGNPNVIVVLAAGNHSLGDIISSLNSTGLVNLKSDATFEQVNNILETMFGVGAGASYMVTGVFEAIQSTGAYYFGAWPLAISYVGQVIPALLVGIFSVWFFTFVEKHTWSAIRYVWPPFITIIVVIFVAHGILGPIGAVLSFAVDWVFMQGFTNDIAKWFVGPIFGLLYPVIVITGIHHTLNAVMLDLTAFGGGTGVNYIFPMLALSNMAQGAAVFAIFWLLRFDPNSKEATTAAGITCWLGVTEPAMFGYNLKYIFPFVAAMIASSVGGLLIIAFDLTAFGIGMGGLLGVININHSVFGENIIAAWSIFLLIMLLVVIISFVLTILLSKKEEWFSKFASISFKEDVAELKLSLNKK